MELTKTPLLGVGAFVSQSGIVSVGTRGYVYPLGSLDKTLLLLLLWLLLLLLLLSSDTIFM